MRHSTPLALPGRVRTSFVPPEDIVAPPKPNPPRKHYEAGELHGDELLSASEPIEPVSGDPGGKMNTGAPKKKDRK